MKETAMIFFASVLTPTRSIGMAAYLFAAILCSIAWARSGMNTRRGRLSALLAVLEWGLFLDMAFNERWLLHELLDNEAMAKNLYGMRVGPQVAAMILLGTAAAGAMGWTLVSLRSQRAASVAVCGAIISISCWGAEIISLHVVDAIFHFSLHRIMLVSLGWVAGALMTGIGIAWEVRPTR